MVHLGLFSFLYYDHDCSSKVQSLKLWTEPLLTYLEFVPRNQKTVQILAFLISELHPGLTNKKG